MNKIDGPVIPDVAASAVDRVILGHLPKTLRDSTTDRSNEGKHLKPAEEHEEEPSSARRLDVATKCI